MEEKNGIFLPPNWITVDTKTGKLYPFDQRPDSLDFSYDAFRTLSRISYDAYYNNSLQAKNYLNKVDVFENDLNNNQTVCTIYHFGQGNNSCNQLTAPMAGVLTLLSVQNKKLADKIVSNYYMKGVNLNNKDLSSFYDKSWYWFSLNFWLKL